MSQKNFFEKDCFHVHNKFLPKSQDHPLEEEFILEQIEKWINKGLSSLRQRKITNDKPFERFWTNNFITQVEKPLTSEVRYSEEVE